MELLARGRDADVYALDERRVLHRRRDNDPPSWGPPLHAHLLRHGYPVPAVLDVDGRDTVYERVHGPLLLEDLLRRPWRLASHARLLAELHRRLHAIAAPGYLRRLGDGDAVLHLDLHPGNVLLGPDGPVVIDWTNARAGSGGQDVAVTWVLLRIGQVPLPRPATWVLRATRRPFLRAFLGAAGRAGASPHLPFAIEQRLRDPNVLPSERAALQRLRVEVGARCR